MTESRLFLMQCCLLVRRAQAYIIVFFFAESLPQRCLQILWIFGWWLCTVDDGIFFKSLQIYIEQHYSDISSQFVDAVFWRLLNHLYLMLNIASPYSRREIQQNKNMFENMLVYGATDSMFTFKLHYSVLRQAVLLHMNFSTLILFLWLCFCFYHFVFLLSYRFTGSG